MFDTPLCFPAARQYHGYGQELDDGHGRLSEDCESGGCRGLFCLGSPWGMSTMGPWGDLWLQTACTSVYSSNTYIYIYIYIHTHSWIVGTSPTTIGGMGIVETSRQMFGGPKESMVSIAPAWMIHHIRRLWSVAGQVWQGIRTIFPECFSPHFFRLSCLLRFIISIYRLKFTLW